jgi:ankyrin repeat protein
MLLEYDHSTEALAEEVRPINQASPEKAIFVRPIDFKDKTRYTALSLASYYGSLEGVRLLLAKGAAAYDNQPAYGGSPMSPADALRAACDQGHAPIVHELLNRTPAPESLIPYFQLACQKGHEEVVRLLVGRMGHALSDVDWSNAIYLACYHSSWSLVRLVLQMQPSDPNAALEGLHRGIIVAGQRGNLAILMLLLEEGADVVAINSFYHSLYTVLNVSMNQRDPTSHLQYPRRSHRVSM